MSEQFQPQIREAQDVSGSIAKTEALHASHEQRTKMLNEHIGAGKSGTIVTREGKNDLWIRKEKSGVLKGVDAMKPGETIKVLQAEYKVDAKDGQPKLYYKCEVDNASTVNGGSSGKDIGWIYAGYIQMDIPAGPTPVPPKEDPKPTPVPPKEDPKPTPVPPKIPTGKSSRQEGPSVYAAFTDSHSPDIDSEGLKPEVTVDMKSEIQEVASQLKDAQNRALAKPKFEMASRIVEAYIGAMQKRAPGLEGKRQGAGFFNGPETNPLLTDDMQKGFFSGEALRTILGEIESKLGDKSIAGNRYDELFKRLQECEIHYADIIDKSEVTKIEKEMRGISENGSEISTDTALNIWDQFRSEYIGDDGSSHDARENIGRLVYEREEGQDNQDLKDFRNALKAEASNLKNSPTPNAMLALGSIDNICKKYGIELTDKDRSSAQKILSDISVAFRDQKVQIRETIARDFLGIAPGTTPTAAQNTLIDSILPKVEGFMLTEGLESAIYPILFYRLHQTDSSWGGSKFDGNKALNKLAWANWDEASKLGQRIAVELGAFAAGGWAVNVLRGGVAAGRIAMLAGRVTEAGRAAQSLATAPRWVQGLSRTINGMMVGASGAVVASGTREAMHDGVAHYGRDAAFGAFYGAIFPVVSTQISRLGNWGSTRIGSMTPDMIKNISARIGLSAARDGSRNLLNRVLVNPTLILGRETLHAGVTLGAVEAGQKILTDDERDFAIAQLVSEAWNVITTDATLAEGLRDMRLEEILPLVATNIMVKQYKQPDIKKSEPKPEDPKGPKPKPAEPLRLENGEPVLKLMENSTHPDVLAANAFKAQRNMDQANAKFIKGQETPLKLMENSTHPEVLNTKLASLRKQYKTLKESGREGQRDRQELLRLNDEIRALEKQITEQKPAAKEESKKEQKQEQPISELDTRLASIKNQIAAAERISNKTTRTKELIRLHQEKAALEKQIAEQKPAAKEEPKTEQKQEQATELTERQRLQKENAEANAEFDRLVNSSEKVDPKALEAARTRKRETAAALEKHLSSETTAKTKEPEAPKTEPKKAPETQKITPEVSQEMAYNVRNYLKGKGSFEHLRDANGRQNGPNSINLGNGVILTRSIEGGLLNGTKVRMGGKEVFEIKRGDKVEKVSGEELGQKLTEKEWSDLNTKISSMNLRAGEKTITLLKDGTMKIEYSDGSTLTAKPGDNRRSTFIEGVHANKSGTIEAKGSFDGLGRLENGTVTISENGTKTTYKTVDKKTNYEQATSFIVDGTTYTLKQVNADGTQEFTRNSNGKETALTLNKGEKINAHAPEIVGRRVKAALDGVKPVKMGKNTEIRTAEIDGIKHVRITMKGFSLGATSGPRTQTFEGTAGEVNGQQVYKGVLDRNYRDGKYEGEFKLQEKEGNFYDMVNATENSSRKID